MTRLMAGRGLDSFIAGSHGLIFSFVLFAAFPPDHSRSYSEAGSGGAPQTGCPARNQFSDSLSFQSIPYPAEAIHYFLGRCANGHRNPNRRRSSSVV